MIKINEIGVHILHKCTTMNQLHIHGDTPPNSLKDSNANFKMKISE
jgi:hypothetical protein